MKLRFVISTVLLLIIACDKNTGQYNGNVIGEPIGQLAPETDPAAHKAVEIVGGGLHVCALLENNRVKCWGDNEDGQCDLKAAQNAKGTPYDIRNAQFSKITAGTFFTCGILKVAPFEGVPVCFGKKGEWLNVPHEKVKDISAGPSFTCFVKSDGKLGCVGRKLNIASDNFGMVSIQAEELIKYGIDPVSKNEKQDFSHKKFKNVKADTNKVCAQGADDGVVYCMGWNLHEAGISITDEPLDYAVREESVFFILKNGKLNISGVGLAFNPIKNISDPTGLKYKSIKREEILTAPGNVYDDGSSMPENTLITFFGISEERVLGSVVVESGRKIGRVPLVCMLKENHKIKCEAAYLPVVPAPDPNTPVLKDIPPEIAF